MLRLPAAATTVAQGPDAVALAVAASTHLFEAAPAVVLAPSDDPAAQALGGSAAIALGVPLLLEVPRDAAAAAATADSPEPWELEAERLGAATVLAVGDAGGGGEGATDVTVVRGDAATLRRVLDADLDEVGDVAAAPAALAELAAGDPTLLVLAETAPSDPAAPAPAPAGTSAPDPAPTDPAPTNPAPTDPAPSGPSRTPDEPAADDAALATLAALRDLRPAPVPGGLVLADGDPATIPAVATARAAGQPVVVVPGGDPRGAATVDAIAAAADPEATVVAFGPAMGAADLLDPLVRAAATGVQLPGGGQQVLPGRRLVALYGSPGYPQLGVLGEQDPAAAAARAQQLAAQYQALVAEPVVPTFEIIATIADAEAGPDGNYSRELSVAELEPWVDAAEAAGLFVVLDLQPGRTDFLTQARQYEELLARPHVGLALDPEWRLAPDQVHLHQIGSVSVDEVNAVAAWLAELTRTHRLPQKLLVLHQFASRMIAGRERLDLTHPQLAVVLHVDGQGTQPAKAGTWAALRQDAPPGLWWGWKNFLDEDLPVLTPEQTVQVQPLPDLITYQ